MLNIIHKIETNFITAEETTEEEEKEEEEMCSICLDTIGFDVYKTNCNHLFHIKCFSDWNKIKNTCPNCNQDTCEQNTYSEELITETEYGISRLFLIYDEKNEIIDIKPMDNNRVDERLVKRYICKTCNFSTRYKTLYKKHRLSKH